MTINNFCRWLLDIIVKNYSVLNNRLKDSQNNQNEKATDIQVTTSDTSSRLSIHSNPFKPIKEVVSKKVRLLYLVQKHIIILFVTILGRNSGNCFTEWYVIFRYEILN